MSIKLSMDDVEVMYTRAMRITSVYTRNGVGPATALYLGAQHIYNTIKRLNMETKNFEKIGAEACAAAYNISKASKSSRLVEAKNPADDICEITADCPYSEHPGAPADKTNRSKITVRYHDVDKLNNCDGDLKVGDC